MTNESNTPGEVRSSDGLGLEPERASQCGLTECRGKPMCRTCASDAEREELQHLLPAGTHLGMPLEPATVRALLAAERERWRERLLGYMRQYDEQAGRATDPVAARVLRGKAGALAEAIDRA